MKSVLKSLKDVPLMKFEIWNENSRFYPIDVAKKKILVKKTFEAMDNNMLVGEINHPEDRFNTNFDFVSHAISSLRLDEQKKELYGDIDILDTPRGRVLKTLSDYGNIGFSARAYGSGRKVREGEIIDANTYVFKTFDAVPQPGFKTSRAKNESEQDLTDDLKYLYETFNEDEKIIVHSLYEDLGIIEKSAYKKNTELLIDNNDSSSCPSSDEPSDGEINTTCINESSNDSRVEEMKVNIDLLEESLTQATNKLEKYKSDISLMNEQFSILKEALKGKSIINEGLLDKLSLLEAKNEELVSKYSNINSKFKALKEQYNHQLDYIKDLEADNNYLNESLCEKDSIISKQKDLLEVKTETIHGLKSRVLEVKNESLEINTSTNSTKPSVRVVKLMESSSKSDPLTKKLYENLNK